MGFFDSIIMAPRNVAFTEIEIKAGGRVVDAAVTNAILEAVVDQHTHLPHMFTLRLHDPYLKHMESKLFDLTKPVEIAVGINEEPKTKLIAAEITALEPEFQKGMDAIFVARGYDKSHRLFRETKSRAFLNVKDSDIARQIASAAGLQAKVDSTNTVYENVYQDNQSDLAFLMQRAWRIGYECFVRDGQLYFRKPPSSGPRVELEWGVDLVSFSPVMTLAEQVDEVIVKGWDEEKQKAIVGAAKRRSLYPNIGERKSGAQLAKPFGRGKRVMVDIPVVNQAEANLLAEARLNELSGAFVEAEGVARNRPELTAGEFVVIKGTGKRFNGRYLLTQVTHIYDHTGLTTTFTVRGARAGLLAEQMLQQEPIQRWPGVVTAVVTNSDDPKKAGRVKLKYPWMADNAESDWARVVSPGGGPQAGFAATPGVNDEVMVAFEHGDFNRPFVLGGLWSGQNKPPPVCDKAQKGETPLIRVWQSRKGHYLLFRDDAEKVVELATAAGHKITLDEKNKKIEIVSQGGHKITLDDNGKKITIHSNGQIEIKADSNLNITAGGAMEVKATGPLTLQGKVVKIN